MITRSREVVSAGAVPEIARLLLSNVNHEGIMAEADWSLLSPIEKSSRNSFCFKSGIRSACALVALIVWLNGLKTNMCALVANVNESEEAAKPGVSLAIKRISIDCGAVVDVVVPMNRLVGASKRIHAGRGV